MVHFKYVTLLLKTPVLYLAFIFYLLWRNTFVNEKKYISHQTKFIFLNSLAGGSTIHIWRKLETICEELLVGTRTYMGAGSYEIGS